VQTYVKTRYRSPQLRNSRCLRRRFLTFGLTSLLNSPVEEELDLPISVL